MIGPLCAVADVRAESATIWSGTQYPHGLARAADGWLGFAPGSVRVLYTEGSGCYGRYAVDDAALEAALLSQEVGRPVRVQWMRADEHGWDHFSPPMAFDVRGGLDSQGNVVAWDYQVWSASHVSTPYLGDLTGGPWFNPNFVGDDTQHSYDWANQRLLLHALSSSVLRYGNLRSLGAMMSAFASESFVDELAAAAGADPVEFRLRYLSDPRAIAVLKAAAEQAGWQPRPSAAAIARGAGVMTGRGVSVGEYGVGASGVTWVAMIADVEVNPADGRVRATRITVAHDCGLIINPDGVRNQIEGNVIQSLSRSLLEEVRFDESGVLSKDWQTYPILTFPEIPEVDIVLLNRPELPAIGAGEPATIPTGAAIANAIFDATGVRLRRIPFTADRVKAALEG
jgi:nicotinate dehydrogenase subunit B